MLSGNGGRNRGLPSGTFILRCGTSASSSTATRSFRTLSNLAVTGAFSLVLLRHCRKLSTRNENNSTGCLTEKNKRNSEGYLGLGKLQQMTFRINWRLSP